MVKNKYLHRNRIHRKVWDAAVDAAIQMRLSNATWAGIGRHFGVTANELQIQIWRRLHARGELKRKTVSAIWTRVGSKFASTEPAWRWLERETKLKVPTRRTRRPP